MNKEFVDEVDRDQTVGLANNLSEASVLGRTNSVADKEMYKEKIRKSHSNDVLWDAEAALDRANGGKESISEARTRVRKLVDSMNPSFKATMPKFDTGGIVPFKPLIPEVTYTDPKPEEHCNVHKPSHYQILPGVEVIDVRKALLQKIDVQPSLYAADCWSRSWEYLTRMWGKNRLEDAKKARVYIDWLIEELEESEPKSEQKPEKAN